MAKEFMIMMHIGKIFPSLLSGRKRIELYKTLRTLKNIFTPYFEGDKIPRAFSEPDCKDFDYFNSNFGSVWYLLNFDNVVKESELFEQEIYDPSFVCSLQPLLYNSLYNISNCTDRQIWGLLYGIPPSCVFP